MTVSFLPSSYDPRVVVASLLIASFASYVALDLGKRVRGPDKRVAVRWWVGGSVALGAGIWCMHFVGMLAFSLPIELGYGVTLTLASWAAAIASSAVALYVASREKLTWQHLAVGTLTMGLGISAMHYLGMAAIDLAPGIVWDGWIVAASVGVAVAVSAAALKIFFLVRDVDPSHGFRYQILAAGVMGLAICGMHYTGMAAASFPQSAVCLSAGALSQRSLGTLVVVCAVLLLIFTLFTSHLDARAQLRTSGLNARLRSANEELRQRALRDPLTGLPNRLLFERRLGRAIQRHLGTAQSDPDHDDDGDDARADGEPYSPGGKVVILFIDLDGFKPVNDTLGHAVGDVVLKEISRRLRGAVRQADTVARLGGDEFVILMECDTDLVDPVLAAKRITDSASETIHTSARPIQISCSIGVAVYPEHGPEERLVAHADAAMYEAKRHGGNTHAFFEPRLEGAVPVMLGLQNDLRHAVERQQLELHYQPKVDGRAGQLLGVEALLRWHHPTHGTIGPLVFIPLAERYGLIGKLGNWVIEEACRQIEAWAANGMTMNVAINLSVHQLREPDLVARIEQALRRHHIDASQLLCEITESVAMGDVKATQEAFAGLAQIGVLLSIDDFGTGYSSLSYLRQLPARQLKIDRSFISDLETSSDARAIVSAVVHLAHDLGLAVVAEGVETAGQRDVLAKLECDQLQGYLFARPMKALDIVTWMRDRDSAGVAKLTEPSEASLAVD